MVFQNVEHPYADSATHEGLNPRVHYPCLSRITTRRYGLEYVYKDDIAQTNRFVSLLSVRNAFWVSEFAKVIMCDIIVPMSAIDSSVAGASDCRPRQKPDGPWLDSAWLDF